MASIGPESSSSISVRQPKRRRISNQARERSVVAVTQSYLAAVEQADLEYINNYLKANREVIKEVRAFIHSRETVGPKESFAKGGNTLSGITAKYCKFILTAACQLDVATIVNLPSASSHLNHLVIYASRCSPQWKVPDKRMEIEKFVAL